MADDDEEAFGGLYENGHWVWDDNANSLVFISDHPPVQEVEKKTVAKFAAEAVVFRDDLDLIEQLRYRRRYQRKLKPGEPDIITLQDVIDVAIYTAPVEILSPALINMLHLPTIERFLRALILCNAYYLQISEEMSIRMIELETKVRTPECDVVEQVFQDNLSDLRVLVGKEYCVMLVGGADTKKYHHMGPTKKRKSLSDKDARMFEMFLRMCVQIVWLALGRKSFQLIELETNRLFKTEIFNTVEHTSKTGYIAKMTQEERSVLLGCCLRYDKKLNTRSPLNNEVFCHREIDYRVMGLGIVKPPEKTRRQLYLWHLIAGKEENLVNIAATLGIIGLPRHSFDAMLKPLPIPSDTKSKPTVPSQSSRKTMDATKSTITKFELYPKLLLPSKSLKETVIPPNFPDAVEHHIQVNNVQRLRWQNRLTKLLGGSQTVVH